MNNNDIKRVLDLYEKYQSINKVADWCDSGVYKIKRILIDNEIICCARQRKVYELLNKGYSSLQISELLGVDLEKIYECMPTNKYKLVKP